MTCGPNIKRVNLNLDKDLVAKVDQVAKENYMSRNGAVAFILAQYFREEKAMSVAAGLIDVLKNGATLEEK